MYSFLEDIKENKSLSCFVFLNSLFFSLLFLIILLFYYNGKLWYKDIKNIKINIIWNNNESLESINKNIQFILDKFSLNFVENIDRNKIKNTLLKNVEIKEDILSEVDFPYTSVFSFVYSQENLNSLENIISKLKSLPAVRGVVYSELKVSWLKNWNVLVGVVLTPLLFFVLVMIFMLVFWSVRLLLFSKEKEIEILYLVGASDFYILKPLLRLSVFILFLSGSLALGFLNLAYVYLKDVFNSFGLELFFLPSNYILFYFGLNLLLALTSSYFAHFSLRKLFT
ncbi:MAG: Cell division protein FtsX [Desulfonauticus sp. 38_4375]|nr:MAG: Cell division protein FtsX [Desulfonauticus sp. 38_4375]